jgi:hypothetical protein
MNFKLSAFLLASVVTDKFNPTHGFTVSSSRSLNTKRLPSSSFSSALNMAVEESPNGKSRLGGNQREPTIQEISVMDDMISKLMVAKPYELPNAVSKAVRVVSSPRFFMRIAERADIATDDVEKEQLAALAANLVTTIEAVVSTTEEKLDDRAKDVENIVKAAAEPDSGEFLVPLSPERLQAMREALLKIDPAEQDETFLSTVDAWMNKSHEDGLDGMVEILQNLLQMYAGEAIVRARVELQANVGAAVAGEDQAKADEVAKQEQAAGPSPAASLMDELMTMDTEMWETKMKTEFAKEGEGSVSAGKLTSEVQRTMEAVVLGLESGSMAQRVQAEYLKELVTRIEQI